VRAAEHKRRRPDESAGAVRRRLEGQFSDQYRVEGPRVLCEIVEYEFALHPDGTHKFVGRREVGGGSLCEFPTINDAFEPGRRRRRYCWTNAISDPGAEWYDGVQKVDMETATVDAVYHFEDGTFANPPAFIPKVGATMEDEGYIVVTVYRSEEHRSDVVILDASTLERVCVLGLRNHVPYQFHGEFKRGFIP